MATVRLHINQSYFFKLMLSGDWLEDGVTAKESLFTVYLRIKSNDVFARYVGQQGFLQLSLFFE